MTTPEEESELLRLNEEETVYATEAQARAACEQFWQEPSPPGQEFTPETWEGLDTETRELWYRVATAAINGKVIDDL